MQRKRTRANGEGSVYWSDSYKRFVAQVTIARDGDKLHRKKFFGPRGDRSRIAKLSVEERMRPYTGRRSKDSLETLESFTMRWIKNAPIRAKTRDQYEWAARKYLGTLGARRLIEIDPGQIRRHLDSLEVGARSRRVVYTVVHRVLREALDLELIIRNPAAAVRAPRVPKREMLVLTPPEVAYLLRAARDDRLEALVVLALTSTMGPGEMLALRKRDVNLERGHVTVSADLVESKVYKYKPTLEEAKNPRRRRRIDLPALAVDALKRRLELRRSEGPGDFVFTSEQGEPIRLSSLRRRWWKALLLRAAELAEKDAREAGDSDYRFPQTLRMYDLRHTANAIMGLAGVPIEVARDRMGHASIKTTVDIYGHLYAQRTHEAVQALDAMFTGLLQSLPHDGSNGKRKRKQKSLTK